METLPGTRLERRADDVVDHVRADRHRLVAIDKETSEVAEDAPCEELRDLQANNGSENKASQGAFPKRTSAAGLVAGNAGRFSSSGSSSPLADMMLSVSPAKTNVRT